MQGAPFGARPERQPLARHTRGVRLVLVLGTAPMLAYLVFRLSTFVGGHSFLPLNLLLLLGELVALAAHFALLYDGWRLEPYDPPIGTARPVVDLLVPVYNEPIEVVRPTLAGCLGQDYDGPTNIWLLDDGRQPAMEELARGLGINYGTRPDNRGAKAGNINHALAYLQGDLVAVLDCDMVPQPDFLSSLVPYFENDDVGLVQTPHGFYNTDSFQHYAGSRHDQSLFYDVLQWGKDRHNAAYWCGTGGILRLDALRSVGGVAEGTITEDFHTSVRLHAHGWRSRYHPVALTFGLGATDHGTYIGQRDRWASGNVFLLHTPDSPLRIKGLTLAQRLSYCATLVAGLAGVRRVCFVGGVALVLATGMLPFKANPLILVSLLAAAVLGGLTSVLFLARGRLAPGDLNRGEVLALQAQLSALTTLVYGDRRPLTFEVTAKDTTAEHWTHFLHGNRALIGLTGFLLAGVAVGVTRQSLGVGLPAFAAVLTLALAGWEAMQLAMAWRFGLRYHQRRTSYRVPIEGRRATLGDDDHPIVGKLLDLSPAGAAMEIYDDLDAEVGDLIPFSVDGMPRPITASIRRYHDHQLGLHFDDVPPESGVVIDRICYVESIESCGATRVAPPVNPLPNVQPPLPRSARVQAAPAPTTVDRADDRSRLKVD